MYDILQSHLQYQFCSWVGIIAITYGLKDVSRSFRYDAG